MMAKTDFRPWLAYGGLFLLIFGVVGLTGPGRIDIVDGQTRFEVAKSLALHGDIEIRDPSVWFAVLPGREGRRYTNYRLPQSLLGVVAIAAADLTGQPSDPRRHFFFSLVGAWAAATLAVLYFWWFVGRGLGSRAGAFWAAAGIVCTPSWFYGTSTFDDVLAALTVVGCLVACHAARKTPGLVAATTSGLLFGLALHVKPPLLAFAPAGLVWLDRRHDTAAARVGRAAAFVSGVAVGAVAYVALDFYKFPPEARLLHPAALAQYVPPFPGHFWWGLAVLAVSPSASLILYCPPVLLAFAGLYERRHDQRRMVVSLAAASLLFFCAIASVSFAKGDPSWGPRYLTPLFAALWLFAPDGAFRHSRREVGLLLCAGFLVQVLALSIETERLHIERRLPSMYGAMYPALHFDPRNADLLRRPFDIVEVWKEERPHGSRFTWSPVATSAVNITSADVLGNRPLQEFGVLNSFRPWWASHRVMPPDQRPVDIEATVMTFAGILSLGAAAVVAGLRRGERKGSGPARRS